MAVVDGPFITARTTPDGYPAALLAVAQLHGAGQLPATRHRHAEPKIQQK